MVDRKAISVESREVTIRIGPRQLSGNLDVPEGARAVVLFAHGSGSSRFSPRNRYVAQTLQQAGLATLLLDLLEPSESDDRAKVFDIELLAERLEATAAWVRGQDLLHSMSLGYFGASTGAAAALVAAAREPALVAAVVSRGGRPDLAGDYLPQVQAPTLLIVGGDDHVVIELNNEALQQLTCEKELLIIPGASHLFPEPGTLEQVARLATQWFARHLVRANAAGGNSHVSQP